MNIIIIIIIIKSDLVGDRDQKPRYGIAVLSNYKYKYMYSYYNSI